MIISVTLITFLNLVRIDEIHDTPTAASKNGIPIPIEYAINRLIPFEASPEFIAIVRMEANTGPKHGDHPAEKKIPIKNDEKMPAFSLTGVWCLRSYSRNFIR